MINLRRLQDVIFNGRKASSVLASSTSQGKLSLWFDIFQCVYRYKMPVTKYVELNFNKKSGKERKSIGHKYYSAGKAHDAWMKDFLENRKFFAKYGNPKYELGILRVFRRNAYTKRYNVGENLQVEHNVYISRQHDLNGTIHIGNNVFLAKNTTIDYSGGLTIGNDVRITKDVDIQTHHHLYHSDWTRDKNEVEARPLVIEDGVIIGTRAIILPSCNRIGKYARIGAGAVVTKDVPDYALVAGIPAKVLRLMSPHKED